MDVLRRINRGDAASAPRLEFRTRKQGEAKPRSYRELVADGQRDLERAAGDRVAAAFVDMRDWPAERPRRDRAGAEARRAQLAQSWQRMRERIAPEITDFTFHIWIEPCELVDATEGCLFVAAPSYVRGWVRERYGDLFRHAAGELAERPMRVFFVASEGALHWPETERGAA